MSCGSASLEEQIFGSGVCAFFCNTGESLVNPEHFLWVQRKRNKRRKEDRAPGFSAALGQTLRRPSDSSSGDRAAPEPEGSSNSSRGDDFEVLPVPLAVPTARRPRRASPVRISTDFSLSCQHGSKPSTEPRFDSQAPHISVHFTHLHDRSRPCNIGC